MDVVESSARLSDPVIAMIRERLGAAYGDRIERVVLYGSRARGDAEPDSDYDVAVFLHEQEDFWIESSRLARLELEILEKAGRLVHTMPFPAGHWRRRDMFMHELRREGVDL